MRKRKVSDMKLADAMPLIGTALFMPWNLEAPPHPPSAHLQEALWRLDPASWYDSLAGTLLVIFFNYDQT